MLAEYAHGKVGGEKDEWKGKCAPCGMETEDFKGKLNQIIAGGNDGDVKGGKPNECFLQLFGAEAVHENRFFRKWLGGAVSDGLGKGRCAMAAEMRICQRAVSWANRRFWASCSYSVPGWP